jgi:hypothetical protein
MYVTIANRNLYSMLFIASDLFTTHRGASTSLVGGLSKHAVIEATCGTLSGGH